MKTSKINNKSLSSLSDEQKLALLKLPVYISLLAASDNSLDEEERLSATKLAHTKSFSCEPLLAEFYREADKYFESNMLQLGRDLPKAAESREAVILNEIQIMENILSILGPDYALAMHRSLKTFKTHVAKAHHSVIEDFVLPIAIPGLTD